MLYRQGSMNLIVNSAVPAGETPALGAIALRVRDAGNAWRHAIDSGAWEIETHASAMELNIPGIHGAGNSVIYFVDRHREFSIYDVDFVKLPDAPVKAPAVAGLHWFGVVQSVQQDRSAEWIDFYHHLLGFSVLPEGKYFGVLPKGTLLQSPCGKFYLQLIEPPSGAQDIHWDEGLARVGLGAPDIPAAVKKLQERGVVFIDHGAVQPSSKGALTQIYLGGVTFELVVSHLKVAQP
jgi:4-hydroxyphenylpyruvate dioxygenase